jgi:hypothetical protein
MTTEEIKSLRDDQRYLADMLRRNLDQSNTEWFRETAKEMQAIGELIRKVTTGK